MGTISSCTSGEKPGLSRANATTLVISLSLSLLRLFGMRGLILFGRFDHSLQFIGTLGSGERLGILAVLFQVAKQKLLKILL